MPTRARAVIVTLLALLAGGCGDEETAIPADAVSEASGIVGSSADDALTLAPADIERLATQANVKQDVLESVASTLAEGDVWTQSMSGVRTIYDDAPEGVPSTLVDVACKAVATNIHTDYQLHYAIFQRVNGFNEQEIDGLTETTFDLYHALYEASRSDEAEDRAAAALTCHTLAEMQG
ncbi:hypothetical protein [Nocardioides sp. SR21]|uniref:hypothetical protein n=1 Tax=Nocardioides sp. SR21 TaxID=2919501 RepID=UPI001FAA08A9|nr:hypothetical protein [Nocardioides sp. SR21]